MKICNACDLFNETFVTFLQSGDFVFGIEISGKSSLGPHLLTQSLLIKHRNGLIGSGLLIIITVIHIHGFIKNYIADQKHCVKCETNKTPLQLNILLSKIKSKITSYMNTVLSKTISQIKKTFRCRLLWPHFKC